MFETIRKKDIELFDYLLDVENINVNVLNRQSRNALHIALANFTDKPLPDGKMNFNGKSFHFIYRLLESGIDIEHKDNKGITPLNLYVYVHLKLNIRPNMDVLFYVLNYNLPKN